MSRPFPDGSFLPALGEGHRVWPEPIFHEASEVIGAFEKIRARGIEISQWALDARSVSNLEARIVEGLISRGGVRQEAARAVAQAITQLVIVIDECSRELASASALAGMKMRTMYEDPIREHQAMLAARRNDGDGLTVH